MSRYNNDLDELIKTINSKNNDLEDLDDDEYEFEKIKNNLPKRNKFKKVKKEED